MNARFPQSEIVFLKPNSQGDEAMQRVGAQHASVVLGRLPGAEQQDGGEHRDRLERDRGGGARLGGAEVGPHGTVDRGHLDLGTSGEIRRASRSRTRESLGKLQIVETS